MNPYVLDIAVPCPLNQTFSYLSEFPIGSGCRVKVSFGRREVIGVVLDCGQKKLDPKIKYLPIKSLIDQSPIFSSTLIKLAHWIAEYYIYPIGEVFATLLPASKTVKTKELWSVTPKGQALIEKLSDSDEVKALIAIFDKKTTLSRQALKSRLIKWNQQNNLPLKVEFADLVKKGLLSSVITKEIAAFSSQEKATLSRSIDQSRWEEPKILTSSQMEVIQYITANGLECQDTRVLKPFLIHGITGSGKTEVYMQLIAKVLQNEPTHQVLVMVPEISLTPQITTLFDNRFPEKVAVVHSGLDDRKRWHELNRIRHGQASILVGPRSAVFASFKTLRLIIVDEEHDQSYKQASGLTYNGRDVALVRAKMEDACVILGSATPAMESFYNAKTGKYHYLPIKDRASGRPLPSIELISTKRKPVIMTIDTSQIDSIAPFGSDEKLVPIATDIVALLRSTIERKEQAIVLVNRRGFAFYLLNADSHEAVECSNCSISLTLHKKKQMLKCHYCGYELSVIELIRNNPKSNYLAVGFGSQQAEDYLRQALPQARIERLDSDTAAQRNRMSYTLKAFKQQEIDILVGTQILAKGHDFPGVTLIVLCDIDQSLNLPDFRAGERTFQLLVQAAGRAGRGNKSGNVLMQTGRPEHPILNFGLDHNFEAFAETELVFRKNHFYPPFSKMVHIEINSKNFNLLEESTRRIQQWMQQQKLQYPDLTTDCKIIGPTVPPIELLRGRFRRVILIQAVNHNSYRPWLKEFLIQFGRPSHDLRLLVDIDPQNLL